jgi:hypothetical protein
MREAVPYAFRYRGAVGQMSFSGQIEQRGVGALRSPV